MRSILRQVISAFAIAATSASRVHAQAPFAVPRWAWPVAAPAVTGGARVDRNTPLHVPNSAVTYTSSQINDTFAPPDWFPSSHAPAPSIVTTGRKPRVYACGYCHLMDGRGRPENATLAGLPFDYIVAQLTAFKLGDRTSPVTPFRSFDLMKGIADSLTDADMREAATYFSRVKFTRPAKVIEAKTLPRVEPQGGLYFKDPNGGVDTLGARVIEMPDVAEEHERRNAMATYTAYVPPGSIARGKTLATIVTRATPKPCVSCHGPELRGVAPAPPIAGRSASYIVRQLVAFRTGARASLAAAPMREVASHLSLDDMIAVAAYSASRKP